jgi:hypothetical protein
MQFVAWRLLIIFIFVISSSQVLALTCPSVAQVQAMKFISARADRYDPTCWQLYSASFIHENRTWHVEFGTFFENQNADEVLKAGQNYFEHAHLQIEHPKINKLPNQVLLCDYMPEGEIFWVSAASP